MSPKSLKDRLIDALIKTEKITKKQLEEVLKRQKNKGGKLGKILVDLGYIEEKELVVYLGQQLNIPPINLSKYNIDPQVANLITERVAKRYQLLPLSKIGKTLTVAMADPLNILAIDHMKAMTGYKVKPVLSTEQDIVKAIEKTYGEKEYIENILEEMEEPEMELVDEDEGGDEAIDLLSQTEQAPVIKIVNLILIESIKRRASDIHIEPFERKLKVRYRIDGILYDAFSPPKKMQPAILARLKIMSGLDITERRIPQDGRFKIKLQNREIDYRVSSLPVIYGEKVVMRALDRSNLKLSVEKLGFDKKSYGAFSNALAKPYGMILITGPTGSGKSTTLYSVLNQLNTPERNIMTIEDPVEYQLEGITQMQVKDEIGLTFSNGLRSLLRQSPNILLIGEIRDSETADIAIKAALTGHIVFSTLHTNDAAGAMTRLMDMHVEPFLIASSVSMAAAQRLVKKICSRCKEPVKIKKEVLKGMDLPEGFLEETTIYKGKGCESCNHSGYFGRQAVIEILTVTDEIKKLVINKASSDEIKAVARKEGMMTLFENGLIKVKDGVTTLEEVIAVAKEE
jgi:type IV pilus assembly protein PilB